MKVYNLFGKSFKFKLEGDVKLSKKQWNDIGREAGWIKTSGSWGPFGKDLTDILSGVVISNRHLPKRDIIDLILKDRAIMSEIEILQMKGNLSVEQLLSDFIDESLMVFRD